MALFCLAATALIAQDSGAGFRVRPGYEVKVLAQDLREARFMEFNDKNVLFLSQPNSGTIQSFRYVNGTLKPLGTFVKDKPTVHGLCWADGWLWFSQTGSVWKARDTNDDGVADEVVNVIPEGQLPRRGGHWWRSLLVTKDSIYTGIGDSGNISDETATERQKVFRFNLDGTNKRLFASGLRNTEKLRLRPGTNEVWGIDHGSDWFGREVGDREGLQPITDYNPPEELNKLVEGGFYGHPFIVGNRVPRYEYLKRPDIIELAAKTIPPAWTFGAHWAINGFCFYTGNLFPAEFKGDMFIAAHGSWNSSKPVGYQVGRVLFDKWTGLPYGYQSLVLTTDALSKILARPVDCVQAPDGSILFSCDATRRIFRLSPVRGR